MAAKDFSLLVTGLTGKVFIGKKSKKHANVMLTDRAEVPKHEFIDAILQWTLSQLESDRDTLQITAGGKLFAEIKIFRDSLK